MKKAIQLIYLTTLFLIILFPMAKFNKSENVSTVENRTLAKKPSFRLSKFSAYDEYFQDRFGGRNQLIELANFIDYKIFHKQIINSEAFKGNNGWFYYINPNGGNNKSDFYKTNLLTTAELTKFKNSIKNASSWCEKNGIKYLFIVCPNKHSVYPENYIVKRPEGISRSDQLISIFTEQNVPFVFSRDYLIEKKSTEKYPLYYETDTHWNNLGAYYTFELIQEELKKQFQNTEFPKIDFDFTVSYSETMGDILPLLGIKHSKSTQIAVKPKFEDFNKYFEYVASQNHDEICITTGKDKSLPTAVVFRDSFFSAMIPYFSTLFSSVEYNWRKITEEDKNNILKNKPDLIVFESVERFADTMAGCFDK